MIDFELKHPDVTVEHLGFIPMFVTPFDPRPVRDQFNERYAHGGGWRPFFGFEIADDASEIRYGDDPPRPLLAEAKLRDETIRIYDGAWVAIVSADGSTEIARMD